MTATGFSLCSHGTGGPPGPDLTGGTGAPRSIRHQEPPAGGGGAQLSREEQIGVPPGDFWGILCPADRLCSGQALQTLGSRWRRWAGGHRLGQRGCAVSRALLTSCLLGAAGRGLPTDLLFVSTHLQTVCFPQKRHKGPLSSACLCRGLLCRAGVGSPGQPQHRPPMSSLCSGLGAPGGPPGRQPALGLKVSEPAVAGWVLQAWVQFPWRS